MQFCRWMGALLAIIMVACSISVNVEAGCNKEGVFKGNSPSEKSTKMLCNEEKGNDSNNTQTPKDYVAFLLEKGKTDPEALKIRGQFLRLSLDKQKKFIYYMTSPKVLREIFETELEENSKKELYNGDIVLTRETITTILSVTEEMPQDDGILSRVSSLFITPVFAAPAKIYDMKVTDVQYAVCFGIKAANFTAWVVYKSKDRKEVISIQAGDAHCANYSSGVKVIKDSVSRYIHGNKAHTAIFWILRLPYIIPFYDITAMDRGWHQHVLGNAAGGKSYRWHKG